MTLKVVILSDRLTIDHEILMLGMEGKLSNRCWVPKRMASDHTVDRTNEHGAQGYELA